MSSTPLPGTGDGEKTPELITRIRLGMEVEDAAGERIGKVADILLGDPDAIDFGDREPVTSGEGLALALGVHREPNVAPGLVGRLLRAGYIKVDDKRHFRRDHHYYATADQVVSVESNTVRLSTASRELITSLD
jgi:hypothetical protein